MPVLTVFKLIKPKYIHIFMGHKKLNYERAIKISLKHIYRYFFAFLNATEPVVKL